MASIRRTLSPIPRTGNSLSGEACAGASPLSKSSTCTQSHPTSHGVWSTLLGSSDSQSFFLKVFSSRPRPKSKGHGWRRALTRFFVCFLVGIFLGLASFASTEFSISKNQDFSFERVTNRRNYNVNVNVNVNVMPVWNNGSIKTNSTSEPPVQEAEFVNRSLSESVLEIKKLLIIVTSTRSQGLQAYHLHRVAHTLKLVQSPLLWIVVEMNSQSAETADLLRRTGIMYRHLVCSKNLTGVNDRKVHQRNIALAHIEMHHLDGIVYFADDDNVYSVDLFYQLRQIRRFGTWMVTKLTTNLMKPVVEGPVCNGTQVIGWHTNGRNRRLRRFHAEMSGFAFNSTILWDPKRWHRPTIEPIRQIDTVKDEFKASAFIEQIVEDENQMECLMKNGSSISVWNFRLQSLNSFYPAKWFLAKNLLVR